MSFYRKSSHWKILPWNIDKLSHFSRYIISSRSKLMTQSIYNVQCWFVNFEPQVNKFFFLFLCYLTIHKSYFCVEKRKKPVYLRYMFIKNAPGFIRKCIISVSTYAILICTNNTWCRGFCWIGNQLVTRVRPPNLLHNWRPIMSEVLYLFQTLTACVSNQYTYFNMSPCQIWQQVMELSLVWLGFLQSLYMFQWRIHMFKTLCLQQTFTNCESCHITIAWYSL